MPDTTTRRGLPYGESLDSPDGAAQVQALAEALDNVAFDDQGTLRPAAGATGGKRGDWFKNTSTGVVSRSDGTTWDDFIKATDTRLTDTRTPTDGSVTEAKLAFAISSRLKQIGDVWMWYRPDAAEPLPPGCVIPIGQTLSSSEHAFASKVGQSVTLPDLRNKMILGANTAIADGTAPGAGDTAAQAPGVRGAAGSNALRDISHAHSITADGGHSHSISADGAHGHTTNSHTHGIDAEAPITGGMTTNHQHHLPVAKNVAAGSGSDYASKLTDEWTGLQTNDHQHYVSAHAHGGYTTYQSDYGTSTNGSHSHGGGTGSVGNHSHGGATGSAGSTTLNVRPQVYGLVFLMRVI